MSLNVNSASGREEEADCLHMRELSSDFIDGELDAETADRILAHLEWCRPCTAFFNTLRATVSLLGSSKPPAPPESFRDRLFSRLRKAGSS